MPLNRKAVRTVTFALDAAGRPIGAAVNERPLKPTCCFMHARLLIVIPVYPTGQIGHDRTLTIDLDEPGTNTDAALPEHTLSLEAHSGPDLETAIHQPLAPAMAARM